MRDRAQRIAAVVFIRVLFLILRSQFDVCSAAELSPFCKFELPAKQATGPGRSPDARAFCSARPQPRAGPAKAWTAVGSEAPHRFRKPDRTRKAVSSLRSATAVQKLTATSWRLWGGVIHRSSLYPTPWTVLIQRGWSGSGSSLPRRLAMWLSTVRVVGKAV